MRVAYVDDCEDQLFIMKQSFSQKVGIEVSTFLYPSCLTDFFSNLRDFDHIMLDYKLGGTNGANLARRVLKEVPNISIAIVTANILNRFEGFSVYFNKLDVFRNPNLVVHMEQDKIERALEVAAMGLSKEGLD